MKAYQITGTDGLSSLQAVTLPDPTPGPGEVLVRVRATCLNYRDYMNVVGIRGVTGPIPRIPCSDGAGEVASVGAGVTAFQPGDRVVCPFMPTWLEGGFSQAHASQALGGAVDGLLRELAVISEKSLLRVPDYLSIEEAATLPCAAVTAWDALHCRGSLAAGETVLIQGTGGVSIFALQFAKLAGARVLATTSSDAKARHLLELGADAVHNYKSDPEVQTVQILRKGIRLDGIYVGSREMFAQMLAEMERVKLKPVIDSTFEFADAPAAFQHIESGKHFGKIVIRV